MTDVYSRKYFLNKEGDWRKTEKLIKEIEVYADVVQELANDLVKADAKLRSMIMEAYKATPKTDALFYDSPVAPSRQTLALRLYLKKLGWEGIRDAIVPITNIRDFSGEVKGAARWLLKFRMDDAQERVLQPNTGSVK